MTNTDILIKYINDIIGEAVIHGGDAGGSYDSNKNGLVDAMVKFGQWYGLNHYAIIDKDGTPQFGEVICTI